LGILLLHFAELLGGQVILGKEELGICDGAIEEMGIEILLAVIPE